MQDSGHLISTVAAIGGCPATGRSSLAGKTTSMTFTLMWLALTTPRQVRASQQRDPATGHSGTGGAYACARVKEAVFLQSLLEPQNGTPKKDDISPLTLPPVTPPVGPESKFWLSLLFKAVALAHRNCRAHWKLLHFCA